MRTWVCVCVCVCVCICVYVCVCVFVCTSFFKAPFSECTHTCAESTEAGRSLSLTAVALWWKPNQQMGLPIFVLGEETWYHTSW
jgi:hypothetical protein